MSALLETSTTLNATLIHY